jgi:hypothetical protein
MSIYESVHGQTESESWCDRQTAITMSSDRWISADDTGPDSPLLDRVIDRMVALPI